MTPPSTDMCKPTGVICEDCRDIARLYLRGESITALSIMFGTNRDRVYRTLRKTNTPLRNNRRMPFLNPEGDRIIVLRDKRRMTWKQIGQRVGVSDKIAKKRYLRQKELTGGTN